MYKDSMHIYGTNVKILYSKIWCVNSKYYKLENKNKNKKIHVYVSLHVYSPFHLTLGPAKDKII